MTVVRENPQMRAVTEILRERAAQDAKWGQQDHTDEWWLGILLEEVGELAKAIIEHHFDGKPASRIRKEIMQAGAVALAWLECVKRRKK